MRSITFKLTLAFLLVGLTGSALVALIVWRGTQSAFDQFLQKREEQVLINQLVKYYQANNGWDNITYDLPVVLNSIQHDADIPAGDFRRNWIRLILVDADRVVIFSTLAEQSGRPITKKEMDGAIALDSNGETIGWLVVAPQEREWIPNSPEGRFLQMVNSATVISAAVAILLALTLGGFLAYTMTRSLRELTEATVKIAKGNLGEQVQVRSQDEIGDLASSFNQMSLDLQRATRVRRQMTADIAHDLRSPLSVISGYAEALSDGKLPGTPEIYNVLYQETKHLSRLVEDLRTLSLADAGELPLIFQTVNPRVLLERAPIRHAVRAQQNNIQIRVEAQAELPNVSADVERMAQVFDNLVLNAFRYTPTGGVITLAAHSVGKEIEFRVSDNGAGIEPHDLPHIFDRFYRGDPSRQQSGESGLGLAIAKSIIEAHGGTIVVESQPEQGATFTVKLPALQ